MRDAGQLLAIWRKLSITPGGKQSFSRLICFETPWAASIRPIFESVQSGQVEIRMRRRRAVLDRDGHIHAMAQGTLAELAAHSAARVTLTGMRHCRTVDIRIQLLQPASNDLAATARLPTAGTRTDSGDLDIAVVIRDAASTVVCQAQVSLHITPVSGTRARRRAYRTPERVPRTLSPASRCQLPITGTRTIRFR